MPGIGGNAGDATGDTGQGLVQEDPMGKHLAVGVAGFSGTMNSYLRLGTASPTAIAGTPDATLGEDLAVMVQGFNDDTRDRGSGANAAPAQAFDPVFQAAFTGDASIGQRRVESAILHSKGGWRDHTDGNRITTTRGDKIELVQGNYKLVVLGRQDDTAAATNPTTRHALLENAAGVDMSGGVTDMDGDAPFASEPDTASAPDGSRDQAALVVEYGWGQQSDGTFGWTMTTRTGHEHPAAPERNNYRVINNNYVDWQEDNYGADDQRVSYFTNQTCALSVKSTTDVSGTNTTELRGGSVENYTFGAFLYTANAAGTMAEVDAAIEMWTVQVAAINANAFIGGVINVNALLTCDMHMGAHTDLHVGEHVDTRNGMHNDVHVGTHVDDHLGTHTEMHTGMHFSFDAAQITLTTDTFGHLVLPAGQLDWWEVDRVRFTPGPTTVITAEAAATTASGIMLT
jgi:hypothetical protein